MRCYRKAIIIISFNSLLVKETRRVYRRDNINFLTSKSTSNCKEIE